MRKLSDFNMKEARALIITLMAELKTIMSDNDLKEVLKAFAEAKRGEKTDTSNLDAIFTVVESLLVTNERAFWIVLAALTQSTVEKVQEMNNIEVIETVTDFLSIDTYKKLLSQGIKSAMNAA